MGDIRNLLVKAIVSDIKKSLALGRDSQPPLQNYEQRDSEQTHILDS